MSDQVPAAAVPAGAGPPPVSSTEAAAVGSAAPIGSAAPVDPAAAPIRPAVPPLLAGNAAFLAVLAVMAVGFAYTAVVPQHWLRGVLIAAGGFLVGALLRLALPDSRAGMLKIRGKALDVACLGAVAVLIVTVSVLLPR